MSTRSFMVPENVYDYILKTSLRETPIQRELRDVTSKMEMARMRTGADQLQFLQLLAKTIGARRCIEVGVFTGASALAVALVLPADGKIIACDVNDEYTAIGRSFWERAGVAQKIDLRLAPATETLDKLIAAGDGEYDFAYIDADKANYEAYYERILRLLRTGGLICIDNVLWGGDVADPKENDADTVALRNLNAKIGRDERVDASLLTIGDGLTVARKR
ncbi:MAG TPA: class I SAM-dependent methyltransferase [Candidatus Rubrimentiphilum sp.]|nr:class I SAM-dependent methyltransferase [Candidatus Rubrimentiphilum sp.]